MPCPAGGDIAGGGGGESCRIRDNADAAKVEAVSIEAYPESGVGLRWAAVVDLTGSDEQIHARVFEFKEAFFAEFEGQLSAARAVLRVAEFIFPTGIVEEGEETDHFHIGRMGAGKVKAVAANGQPMRRSVDGMRAELEPGGDELPEMRFGGGEHYFSVNQRVYTSGIGIGIRIGSLTVSFGSK